MATIGSENKSELTIGLVNADEHSLSSKDFMLKAKTYLEDTYPGLEINSTVIGITQSDEPIQLVLNSEDRAALMKAATDLATRIKVMPGANDVSVSVED